MFCNKCGNELEKDARFCSLCGNEVECEVVDTTTGEPQKESSIKKTNLRTKILLIIMVVVIVVMGSFIAIHFLGNHDKQTYTDIGEVEDKDVDHAIAALTLQWESLYKDGKAGNGYLEIAHTRVVKINPLANDTFFSKLDRGSEIEYIVEFVLYSDYFGSAPYYHNTNTCDTVIIYKDGTTSVTNNVLYRYSCYTYSYDYSNLVVDIVDYGALFNKTINIK